jgi:hypothetical protein
MHHFDDQGNIVCDPWNTGSTLTLSVDCSFTPPGAPGPGCANIVLGSVVSYNPFTNGTINSSVPNEGNVRLTRGNSCCLARIKACNPDTECCTPYTQPILISYSI